LYQRCFPHAKQFTEAYIDWLYLKNPCGPALCASASIENYIIGAYAGIPAEFNVRGQAVRGLIGVNVAVDPRHQGRQLFRQLSQALFKRATNEGYAFILGVANRASTPLLIRQQGFSMVSALRAAIGVGRIGEAHLSAQTLEGLDLYRIWRPETLLWRLNNPLNPVRLRQCGGMIQAFAHSNNPLFEAYGEIPMEKSPGIPEKLNSIATLMPRVYLGLLPKKARTRSLYLDIPERMKPSPLNLVYRPFQTHAQPPNPEKCLFSFLDFDAF
jgi:GNAT superfamily N-acetyltransferase